MIIKLGLSQKEEMRRLTKYLTAKRVTSRDTIQYGGW
jgi:hypothetical protein